eukprot:NODE_47_length_32105_cov_1.240892.p31 type:complete len:102 gc:universal NODE_47_length_32105_cov_1.240892:24142-24447(+)
MFSTPSLNLVQIFFTAIVLKNDFMRIVDVCDKIFKPPRVTWPVPLATSLKDVDDLISSTPSSIKLMASKLYSTNFLPNSLAFLNPGIRSNNFCILVCSGEI